MTRVFQKQLLTPAAIFALAWAFVRALVQSITIDEAFTYLYFVAQPFSVVFQPGSNNHILNSLLMRISTHAFGTSNLTVRAPALLGAVLYVCLCYFLCKYITDKLSLQFPLFICLTFNPFISDFMVAARGYSLANAFLLAAIAAPVWNRVKGRPSLPATCALASIALGLSFAANFSFAFVDGAAFLALAAWAIQQRASESVPRILAFCALPGIFVALLICGNAVAHWPKGDLLWGAHSVKEMRRSLVDSSFYRPSLPFQTSTWFKPVTFLAPQLVPLLFVLCLCKFAVAKFDGSWLRDTGARWLGTFAAALAGIAALSVTVSWLAFHFYQLPLPLGRTGIYLVPLCTLIAGAIAAAPSRSAVSQWLSRGLTAVFICLSLYFILCLRLNYFKEYDFDADIKDVYSVMAQLNHTYGVADANVTGLYVSALNYYRVLSGRETFPKFELEVPELSPNRSIYVVDSRYWRDFVDQEKLAIVYRGKFSDVVVAVKPGGPIPAEVQLR